MYKWIRPIRTALQVLIALIPVVPLLVHALGLSATVGAGASMVTVASLISAVMQSTGAERILSILRLGSKSLIPSDGSPRTQTPE